VTPENEDVTRRDFMYSAAAAGAAAIITPNDESSRDDIDRLSLANARKARESFIVFRRTIRPGILWTPFVGRLTRELQRFSEAYEGGGRPKLAICTPPQHGKSTAAIYASYSEDLGIRTNLNLQRLFTSQRFRDVFPDFQVGQTHSRGLRAFWHLNSNLIEYIDHVGSFRNTTVEGKITGMELHLGILDDFVKGRAEANSKTARDKTWNWFVDDFFTRFANDNAFLTICTRWHIDDVIGRLKKKWGDELVILEFRAIAEEDEGWRKKGDPLFPEHKPLDFLMERKKLMSEASWHAEYQQRPFLSGNNAIPIEKLKIITHFDRADISATVLSVDKAGTEGGDGAQTAIVIMHKMKDGTYVIERIVRGRWAALERETLTKRIAEDCRNDLSRLGVSFRWCSKSSPAVAARSRPSRHGQLSCSVIVSRRNTRTDFHRSALSL
jgi:hypothetical protein